MLHSDLSIADNLKKKRKKAKKCENAVDNGSESEYSRERIIDISDIKANPLKSGDAKPRV